MTALLALLALGCTASLDGDEPENAKDYADRVTVHTGERPAWSVVAAKSAELGKGALVERFRRALQRHVDETAQARGYDSGVSIASYVGSTVPAWAAEAERFVSWRDALWAHAYVELDKVQSGARPIPTVDEMLAELPGIEWP